jgi:hypothetical protein
MNRKVSLLTLFLLVVFVLTTILISTKMATAQENERLAPVGTGFTYQGKLTDGGSSANGSYDFRFTLYDGEASNIQIESPVILDDVPVTEGLFTVLLDFGTVFDGTALWMAIGVREGSSTGTYTPLSPRQQLTASPYAINADYLDGQHASAFASVAHDHLGETWTGINNSLTISGTFGPASAPLVLSNSDPLGDGLLVSSSGDDGVYVVSADNDGVHVNSAGDAGLEVTNALDGVRIDSATDRGVEVISAVNGGVYVGYVSNGDGFDVNFAGDNGIEVSGATNYAGHFTGDIYVSGSCTGCTMAAFGVNASDTLLHPGDLVTIQGVLPDQFESTPMLMQVGPSRPGETIVGVVQGRAEVKFDQDEAEPAATTLQLVPREGAAAPGNYLTIVIYGPMQVRVHPSAEGIHSGTRLTVETNGLARPLQTVEVEGVQLSESAPTIGIALDEPTADGLVWVLVNPH